MKRLVLLLLVFSIPVLLSMEVWQVFRFQRMREEVRALEAEQNDWLDQNKKILANISLFRSPERIESVAMDELGLEYIRESRVTQIKIRGGRGF